MQYALAFCLGGHFWFRSVQMQQNYIYNRDSLKVIYLLTY